MENWLNLCEKYFIVTGASSGIGRSITEELLKNGAKVVNCSRKEGSLQHRNLFFIETDLSSKKSIEESVKHIHNSCGKIDGLINNAGVNFPSLLVDFTSPKNIYELSETNFQKMMAVNINGTYFMSQAVSRIFIYQRNVVIINVSSESGLEGSEGQSAYAATKAAINSFTCSWTKELGKYSIRVVGIAPGIMEATKTRKLSL